MFRSASVIVIGMALASVNAFAAAKVDAHHARIELVSQEKSVSANHPLLLGVHFALEKDWHIYWTNPGDSGQPPVLEWQLPSGFAAGKIEWPRPEKLRRSSLADYGYKDDAVLLVALQAPDGLKSGSNVDIGLKAKWLICSDVCIPDHAELHLSLPVSSAPAQDPAEGPLFTEAKKRLPKSWPHSWTARASSQKENFVLVINSGKPIAAAEFLPLQAEQIDNAAAQPVQETAHGARITLKKSDQLLKPVSVLKGLVVLDGEAYWMQAVVTH